MPPEPEPEPEPPMSPEPEPEPEPPMSPEPLVLVPVLAVVDAPIFIAYHGAPKPLTPLPLACPGAESPANR
jgi:hypothetical protein